MYVKALRVAPVTAVPSTDQVKVPELGVALNVSRCTSFKPPVATWPLLTVKAGVPSAAPTVSLKLLKSNRPVLLTVIGACESGSASARHRARCCETA